MEETRKPSEVIKEWLDHRVANCIYSDLRDQHQLVSFLSDCNQDISFLLGIIGVLAVRIEKLEGKLETVRLSQYNV